MDAVLSPPHTPTGEAGKQHEILLDALKAAITTHGEHRLFGWGKLTGLFPSRVGPSAAAAAAAVRDGLLEPTHTESRGKMVVEWVRATPRAVQYIHEHDSPKAVLRELQQVIGETQDGVPTWMTQACDEAAQLAMRFEHTAREMMKRLDALSERVEAALRRAELERPTVGEAMAKLVPWGVAALEHLDRRHAAGGEACRLPELFHAVQACHPALTVPAFHDGIRRLHDGRLIQLSPPQPPEVVREPEYAVAIGGQMMWLATR